MKEFCNISSSDSTTPTNISAPAATTTTASMAKKTTTTITTRMMMSTSSSGLQQQINGETVTTVSSNTSAITKDEDNLVELMEVDSNTTTNEETMSYTKYALTDVPVLVKRPLKLNEYWYVLDQKWYEVFLAYLDNKESSPGPIDNSSLLQLAKNVLSRNSEPVYRLKPNVEEGRDFIVIPEEAWNLLVETFGTVDGMGGYPIRCPIIQRTDKYFQVELRPLELRLTLYGSKEDMVVQYSRNCTLKEVIDEMKKLFHIAEDKPVQLWNNATLLVSHSDQTPQPAPSFEFLYSPSVPRPPPPPPSTSNSKAVANLNQRLMDIPELEAANVVLTLEVENNDHTWPSSKTKSGAVTRSKYASGVPNCPPGVCGLMNLGNTCFMNAAIQCLSNTAPLTKYFLADHHLADINVNNPLGMRGEIARCYSDLIKTMWSGFHSNVAPREFKIVVTQFAPQFSGFAHHDCQELMAFLLDGLHEDLNRVKVKPYIEMKNDIERRPDKVVAAEAWENYKLRNDSIIVDTFHAQLKSTLVCPECELVSVTFDPFCYLSLPLPYRIERSVDILLIPAISKRPTKNNSLFSCATSTSNEFVNTNPYTITVRSILLENVMIPKTGCASDISVSVAKFLNEINLEDSPYFNRKFDPKKLIVAHIMECRLNKIYGPNDLYNSHLDDIVIYEMDDLPTTSNSESGCQTRSSAKFSGHHLPVFMKQINADSSESFISRPFLINIKSLTYENIREAIFKELVSIVSPEKITAFLQSMEESIIEEEKVMSNSLRPNKHRGRDGGGSDGEASDEDEEEEMIQNNSNSSTNYDDDNDLGVFEGQGGSNSDKKQVTYPPFTIALCTSNGHRTSVLTPGSRVDNSVDSYLAISIHYRIVTKFFPNNINRWGMVKLSSMLPNSIPMNTNSLLTLKECINQFTLTEKLGENDPWYCPRCKKHQMASKKFDIWSLPNNLIIHLKRFSYSRLHRDKLNVLVEFPVENLDMSPYVLHNPNNESFVYDLIAVSNHYGELGAGHYNAYAKNFLSKNWYLFDDYSVSAVSDKNKVMTKAAYVLFYQRKQQSLTEHIVADNATVSDH